MSVHEGTEQLAWHELEAEAALRALDSDAAAGLDTSEAARRLASGGGNRLVERGQRGVLRILGEQFSSAMVLLLIVAAVVSFALHETRDGVAILVIVLLNATLGFFQEFRAERAMAALKRLAVPHVRVRRSGHVQEISAADLVPGDIFLLEAGGLVPADCRLIDSANLRVQEAALTGESEPVDKTVAALPGGERALADCHNLAYMGTVVVYGRGEAVVTRTGMHSEIGHIADMLQEVTRGPTPLQRRLARLGRRLAVAALAIVAVVVALGLMRGEESRLLVMTALSMAVAAVPEGLPAVATVALALGARRMLKRRALIRKLPAVEALGSVTVICSDKTGTLTQNQMSVEIVDLAGDRVDLGAQLDHAAHPGLSLLLAGGDLCNDAVLETDSSAPGMYHAVGEPTEGALVVAAARVGYLKAQLEGVFERVDELPFDSERKRMTTLHRIRPDAGTMPPELQDALGHLREEAFEYVAFTKGAVESVLEISSQVWVGEQPEALDAKGRERIQQAGDELASQGMRVMGVCAHAMSAPEKDFEQDLVFLGMVGLLDPPRPEVAEAVARCRTAGIRPVMITGDHPLTALHIAEELGIAERARVHTGAEVAAVEGEALEAMVAEGSVFARVAPEHKLRIVEALQRQGHIVAMTGDGVNDAPALKTADIGVAMGITGTDVAKEAADTVLLDDNFATVVNAVEEGRTIFDNIRKFVVYTLTSNAGEIWVMLMAPFLGMPLPLLPLQILWVNLVTDGFPGLALALEPAERNVMRRPPVPPGAGVLNRAVALDILWIGLLMGGLSLGVGYAMWTPGTTGPASWQTMLFTVLTLSQMGNVLALRSSRDPLWRIGFFSNPALVAAVGLTFALQLAVIYLPFLQGIFQTVPLSLREFGICLLVSSGVYVAVEARKVFRGGDTA